MVRSTTGLLVSDLADAEYRTVLLDLAERAGVATGYRDQGGRQRDISAEVVRDVLTALDLACDDVESARASLTELGMRDWRRTVPSVVVARADRTAGCWVHVPHGTGFRAHIEFETGEIGPDLEHLDHKVAPVEVDGVLVGEAQVAIPTELPLGWHRIIVASVEGRHECVLVVTPPRIPPPRVRGRGWGFATQLYSIRSAGSWGLGDLSDLAQLVRWSGGELGADHLIVNPLHAAEPTVPRTGSPYLPTTRRFVDPAYLRVEAIEEYRGLAPSDLAEIARLARDARSVSGLTGLLDRDATWLAKRAALEIVFARPRTPTRQQDYAEFVVAQGEWLGSFATWCALAEELGPDTARWPPELASARGAGVSGARRRLALRIDFHSWLQWQLDQQLAAAQIGAGESGQTIGVIHDLAVGVHPSGADVWALPELFARGVSVGCPPDGYNQQGQDWSQPPWRPDVLEEQAYEPYRDLVRAALRNAGGLRIDHILGLFRLWWIPRGRPAVDGTYVRYDHDALLGILALEAVRAQAVIIGEDLGTVAPEVAETLTERGLLGTTVLWFERWGAGRINPPETWRASSLAAVTVHDLPPSLGYLAAEHVRVRAELGLLQGDVDDEYAAAAAERSAWVKFAQERGVLATGVEPTDADIVVALHRILGSSNAQLVAIALADAAGERRAQNQPGTHLEYPNWRIPLLDADGEPVTVERLRRLELPRRLVAAVTG